MPLYTPLPDHSVRFLRILPHSEGYTGIRCSLLTSPLLNSGSAHTYEALSYTWGHEDCHQFIEIDGYKFRVKPNLYAALSQLQDRLLDRILWIDAVCINQDDDNEKAWQVQCMARIYAKASRVIVWLGIATHNSDQALETILEAAERSYYGSAFDETPNQSLDSRVPELNQQAVLTLLERPWFRRIWVSLEHLNIKRSIINN
jgi:hypothetical protein